MKKGISGRYKEIIEAAGDECERGRVEILDTDPEVNYAKGGGYWVQAWIYVPED